MGELKGLVIHCTDTPAGREVSRKDIEQWHLKERGWKQVGYADMIHLDGGIENLVPYDNDDCVDPWEITNGARGFNSNYRHVVYVGGKNGDTRTPQQKKSLEMYVKAFLFDYPGKEVIGHNELDSSKECPSYSVPAWLKSINVK